ncbi:hypothetical protein DHW03_06460 [Pedobacter yonginense]|uniref:Glycosyl transferase family 28 C-terminal domain-containing protein n=1 Tax=Pedobacter yonginense TaxID=651869 RepID=A0A317EUU7_9SPHI|nr:glycosyltransferase [Pedobacter yonginense]PWS29609.1 hypothetical protein DHW03_06460 [Pedobacter yonginense]
MATSIAFYIHHHGSGHLMRALQIVKALGDVPIILMGSGLSNVKDLPVNVSIVHLPFDTAQNDDEQLVLEDTSMGFHYAPIGVKGIRERAAMMTAIFREAYPLILVVDVSVEVALLARLSGIPTIIMRQHGKRDDLPHVLAYRSAELLVAPFSESMYQGQKDENYQKTFFTGGFSRFDQLGPTDKTDGKTVSILIGKGGTSFNLSVIEYIAKCCPSYRFHVIGLQASQDLGLNNVVFHGQTTKPIELMNASDLIIGNTGHNTVMEVATLNKRFIGVPENRPFDEQVCKGEAIRHLSGIAILSPDELLSANWFGLITELKAKKVNWEETINPKALEELAQVILTTAQKLFSGH